MILEVAVRLFTAKGIRAESAAESSADRGRVLGDALAREICRPGFRGCPFINAAAEYPDPASPVRAVVSRFRAWMTDEIERVLASQGLEPASAAPTARRIMMLRDGALVEGYVSGDPERVAGELEQGIDALVAAATR